VFLVCASGFFTTSYAIFSTNVISLALLYVHPNRRCHDINQSLIINLTTLTGTLIGMILFGLLADRYGRSRIYGIELAIVILATVGLTTASTGQGNYMNIYGWVGFWRFVGGIGYGAEVRSLFSAFPLSNPFYILQLLS
jgi:PHS family inorganic phosphate transporter-like MFS transporter